MSDFFRDFLRFAPGTALYEGSLFGEPTRHRTVLSERGMMQFLLSTGATVDEARTTVLSGLARGSIRPSPRRSISEDSVRAFLAGGGETETQINEFLSKRRAYNRARSDVIALRQESSLTPG